jgi:pimeloyl-ACP methyl ester carboxylesterase
MTTVVLLHGLGGDAGFWTAERFAPDVQVLAPDLRGSGSTPTGGDFTIDTLADDVAALLDDVGARSAHVVGFSMGGLVAQSLAARHPERVDRLVLASTYPVMNPQARMFLDAVRDVVLDTGSMRPVFPLVCPWLFSIGFLADPAHADWFAAPEEDGADDEPPAGWLAQYAAQRAFDGTAALPHITAPTLVVRGAEDALVSAADAAALTAAIPHARATTITRSGHLVNVEQPDRWRDEVLGFLKAH